MKRNALTGSIKKALDQRKKANAIIDGQNRKVALEQLLIATYSIKYHNYIQSIRNQQVEHAKKTVEAGAKAVKRIVAHFITCFISIILYTNRTDRCIS